MDFLLPIWNPFIVGPLTAGLRALAGPLSGIVSPGMAGGLAIILFTIIIRLVLLPLTITQVRSQKRMMAVQPELKEIQRKFKGDREGLARAQMALYKERGVNPAAGCLPLFLQMPILFGMYSAMINLATLGLTLDQVQTRDVAPGRIEYTASRQVDPLPTNQFVLAQFDVVPRTAQPVELSIPQDQASIEAASGNVLAGTQGLTLAPGQAPNHPSAPNTPGGMATLYLASSGERQPDGTLVSRSVPVQTGTPYRVEILVNAPGVKVSEASLEVTFDPALADVTSLMTPEVTDVPFHSAFLWLPSLGEPDLIYVVGFGVPGLLLILMTITSFVSQRMTTLPSADPQQQAIMRSMAFMPLMYLFIFTQTPAGLVLYWFVSNLFTMVQQYFTTGLGMLAGDLQRLTGRNLQPSWARVGEQPAMRSGGESRADSESADANGTAKNGRVNAISSQGAAAHPSRRSGSGKGRKRGKR